MPTQKTQSVPTNGTTEFFELELTQKQVRALSRLLPSGITLGQAAKPASKKVSSNPTKKVFTSEGAHPAPQQAKPKQTINQNDILINKHALRHPEKRKVSYHLEHRYPDFEPIPMTSSKSNKANNDALRKCYNLLQKLKKHPASGPFLLPVDVVALGLHDYYNVVKEPMDLSTVENRMKHGYYFTAAEFAEDCRKIWNNAFLYNMKGSPIYYLTSEMSVYFEKLYKDVEVSGNDTVRELERKVEALTRQISQINQSVSSPVSLNLSRAKSSGVRSQTSIKISNKPLTLAEKQQLGQTIPLLSPEHLRGVWDIVSQGVAPSGNDNEEMVFDIEKLPVDVARELQRYVKHKMSLINRAKNRNKAKELALLRETSAITNNYKHQDGDYDNGLKGEDELTTQHHSVTGSDGKPDQGDARDDVSVASSESSFISDSDSDGEEGKHHHHRHKEGLRVLP